MTTSTISTFLNAIPSGAPEYKDAQQLLTKIALAASTNAAHGQAAKNEIPGLVQSLMNSLQSRGRLPPCTLLALAAAVGTQVGFGYSLPDVGVTGTVTNTAITVTAGVY